MAADCGARGADHQGLLSHHFTEVDVIGPWALSVQGGGELPPPPHLQVQLPAQGLQEVEERPGRSTGVDQWCISHLTDEDCVEFLKVCSRSLKPEGVVVVKENNARRGFVLDKQDSSVTRSDLTSSSSSPRPGSR